MDRALPGSQGLQHAVDSNPANMDYLQCSPVLSSIESSDVGVPPNSSEYVPGFRTMGFLRRISANFCSNTLPGTTMRDGSAQRIGDFPNGSLEGVGHTTEIRLLWNSAG